LLTDPTNQHESFRRFLSSLAHFLENFLEGHSSKDYTKSSTLKCYAVLYLHGLRIPLIPMWFGSSKSSRESLIVMSYALTTTHRPRQPQVLLSNLVVSSLVLEYDKLNDLYCTKNLISYFCMINLKFSLYDSNAEEV